MTRAGWVCVTAALVLLVLGYALGYAELLALGVAALVVLALGGLLVTGRPRVRVDRRIDPVRVGRGDPCTGTLEVRNLSSARRVRVIAYEPVTGGPSRTEVRVPVPTLPRAGSRRAVYQLPTDRRGVLDVGPMRWERTDPFGLWRRRQQLGNVQRVWVHPRVHPVRLAASGRARHLDGPTSDNAPRGSITFHALREYVRGDDMRTVHWKSSARTGTLMVKENVDTALPHTTVLFDTRSTAYDAPARFEEAVDLVASLLTACTRAQFPYRLATSDGVSMEGKGTQDETRAVLDLLAGIRPGEPSGGFTRMADALDHRRTSSVVVAVTGRLDPARDAAELSALRALARRYDKALLVRLVPEGTGPVVAGDDVVLVDAQDAERAAQAWNLWSRR